MREQVHFHCLCGKIVGKAYLVDKKLRICHCSMCRRSTGGTGFSYLYLTEAPLIESQQKETIYQADERAERAFCATCGSTIYYHALGEQGYCLAVGILDNLSEETIYLAKEYYLEDQPAYYSYKHHQ